MSALHRRALGATTGLVVALGALVPATTAATAHDVPAGSGHAETTEFDKVPLVTEGLADPFELDVAEDGRVVYIQRTGQVVVLEQDTLRQTTALDLDYSLDLLSQSDGLLGLTLDDDFTENGWLYLLWSDPDVARMNLSRFTMGADSTIDPASEKRLLDFTIWRGEGRANSHMAGSLATGPDGDLYVATGDNADPFDQQGYTPIDERPGRRAWDAQATSANTNDLRGKILRITPEDDGTYSVPEGNLFAPGTEGTRPEIFGMGFRNPFRITVDPATGAVLVGDYGPDARVADPLRGPEGQVEFIRMTEPGNHGWPYCHADNQAYIDYDFATGASGQAFNCANPVNDSPHNTGLRELPPSQEPLVWYGYGPSEKFPELGSGGAAPMGGPVYRYDPELDVKTKFPESFDGHWFVSEYARNFYKVLSLDEATGELLSIDPFLEGETFVAPFEAEFGPDGSLYIIDFGLGRGAGRGSTNTDAGIYRIDYAADGRRPISRFTADVDSGPDPLTVAFTGDTSESPDGLDITYAWDFENDGVVDSTEADPMHTYTDRGQFSARLTVTDSDGFTGVSVQKITVGNTRPDVSFGAPFHGGFAELGDTVAYSVDVADAEDGSTEAGTIDCEQVTVNTQLGHDTHAHPLDNYTGCSGSVFLDPADHGVGQNVYPVLGAGYEDLGADGVPALAGQDILHLQVRDKEAEFYADSSGVTVADDADARGGRLVTDVDHGDWIAFDPVDLRGIDGLTVGAVRGAADATVTVRAGSPTGRMLGQTKVRAATGAGQVVSPTIDIEDEQGATTLYLAVTSKRAPAGGADLGLDWLVFHGRGVADATAPVVTAEADRTGGTAGLSVDLSGSALAPEGREIASYQWDLGDGTTADGPTVTHVYEEPGRYTARLIATDSEGTRDWTTVEITVADTRG
ncbi:PKD domain-containing protein [Promicromonospora iranensis]|uniref:PKD repeat protein/glucose/arabinose dehydrogenase n=1 Tax=Promicromonospora iranensis TaxID=1105144 RepID=A0ABU2CUR1_9MICO|nr:PKD domain-containing protein [Promicromonospora iranensis]MDR7385080.1 PKD repeat protein/glucose/arabinose dehydrogenase [Promicromonospora iranensis]